MFPTRSLHDGRGFMVYVECTGRMHAVLNVLQCMCAASVRILGVCPHFIWQRLGRSAGYPSVQDALCSVELRRALFASRPFEEYGLASMRMEIMRRAVTACLCDDLCLQGRCRSLHGILCRMGLRENCWCLVWSCLSRTAPVLNVTRLVRMSMYGFSTRIRMVNDLLEHHTRESHPWGAIWDVPEFEVWAEGAMLTGRWMNDPRTIQS